MFRLKFLSPFQFNGRLSYKNIVKFSSQQEPKGPTNATSNEAEEAPNSTLKQNQQNQEGNNQDLMKKEEHKNGQVQKPYSYNPGQFDYINSNTFLERMEKMEQRERLDRNQPRDGLVVPILLCAAAGFIYWCWQSIPYQVIYKHTTVNEYLNQRGYYWAAILSPLSFQQQGHFGLYFPLMMSSLYFASFYLKQRHIVMLYLLNSLITTASVYYFEKNEKKLNKLITPKVMGAVTPLCFATCFMVLKPDHLIFGSRMLPYSLLLALYYMYEYYEYTSVDVNEICREAHFTAIATGFIYGLVFRGLVMKGKI